MSSLVQKSFRILLGRGTVSVFSLLFTAFFAYELPKAVFALIALYETAVGLSKVLMDLGLHYHIIREAPRLYSSDRREEAIRTIIMPSSLLRFIASVLVMLIFTVICFLFFPALKETFPDIDFKYVIIIASFHLWITNIEQVTMTIFSVRQQFGADAFLESAAGLLENMFAMVGLLFFGIDHYFTGILIAITFVVIIRLYLLRDLLFPFQCDRMSITGIQSLLKTYFPFYVRKFFRLGFTQGQYLLIAGMLPLEQLANYKVARKFSGFLRNYIQAFSDPLVIKLSKSRDVRHRKEFTKTFLLFTIPVPILLTFASPWIMSVLGGPKYEDSWFILTIMYASYVFYALSALQFTVISVFGKPMEFLMRDVVGGLVGLSTTFVLIILFKEYGIAWGQLVSYAVLFVLGFHIANRYLKQQPRS